MVKCGNCHNHHDSIDGVRLCYSGEHVAVAVKERREPQWPASDKQVTYVMGLQEERLLPEDYTVKLEDDVRQMERDEVSALITMLKSFSRKEGATTARKQWGVPDGRYAIMHEDRNEWWFFEVQHGKGRWEGYTFIKRLIGAPGAYRKVDMRADERQGWLAAIERDPNKAMTDYGLQSGVCGRCASPLTDPVSLARGIGPICLGKLGW